MKEFKTSIDIPMFLHEVEIIITSNILKSRKKYNKFIGKYDEDEEPGGLCCTDPDRNKIYIFLPKNSQLEVMAHESFHAVYSIFRRIGGKLSSKSEEFFAYGLGYLCYEVEHFFNEVKDKFKKKKKKNEKVPKSK